MKWFQLITALLPLAEEIAKAVEDAINAGKAPADVHQTITDHVSELPAKIRAV